LEDSQADQIQPRFREALLDGYDRVRPLSDDQLDSLDLFLAAYAVFWSLYAVDAVRWHPSDREYVCQRMARYFRLVEHFLSKN
jgi:Ser/Thr protein kinase RdoA (MazF antagonist)